MSSFSPMPSLGDQYDQSTPLQQATIAGLYPQDTPPDQIPSTGMSFNSIPSWSDQLSQASGQQPDVHSRIQDEMQGIQPHISPSQDGSQNKWLSSLAPLLAGAAAVLGGASGSNAVNGVLGGIASGYSNHLMTQAKEAAALKHDSDTKTIDLAHKYLAMMPGDVDPQKYPRLAELGQKIREQLVDGKLSNPKEAQDFILQFTHYKNDIDKEAEDTKQEQEVAKSRAPMDALNQALLAAGVDPSVAGSALMHHYGGLAPDPNHPGQYLAPQSITGQYGMQKQDAANTAAATRAEADRQNRKAIAEAQIAAANGRTATVESGRNSRSAARLGAKGGDNGKAFSTDFKAAQANALAKDKLRPASDPNARQQDVYDYMLQAGHVVPITGSGGQVGYYIGNGQVTTNKAKAEAIAKGQGKSMLPPPSLPSGMPSGGDESDYGEEEDE